jgi:nucleotide-binding universal stress UspA family protein
MLNIRRIIVPVDFGRHTEDIAAYAIDLAKSMDAKPTFLYVVEDFAKMAGYSEACPTCLTDAFEEIRGNAQKKMTALLEQYKAPCPGCSGVVLKGEGEAADDIIEYARDEKADLIVIGTHGTKGIEHLLLGSVAERVVKGASCPILIFNPYKGDRGYTLSEPINEVVEPL